MTRRCSVLDEDLVAHADGYLTGARRELVEAHLTVCPSCQERLQTLHDVDMILQEHAVLTDDAAARATLRRRLAHEAYRLPRHRRHPLRLAATVALLLAIALITWPATRANAGLRLGRFVHFTTIQVHHLLPGADQKPLALATTSVPATLPFPPVEPLQLPSGFARVQRATPTVLRLELLYQDATGQAFLLSESPARPEVLSIQQGGNEEILAVQGTEVLWLKDPRADAVAGLVWERKGVIFELFVTQSQTGGQGGLRLKDGVAIVQALMEEQDGTGGG